MVVLVVLRRLCKHSVQLLAARVYKSQYSARRVVEVVDERTNGIA